MNLPPLITRPKPDPLDAFTEALALVEQNPTLEGLPLNPREPR